MSEPNGSKSMTGTILRGLSDVLRGMAEFADRLNDEAAELDGRGNGHVLPEPPAPPADTDDPFKAARKAGYAPIDPKTGRTIEDGGKLGELVVQMPPDDATCEMAAYLRADKKHGEELRSSPEGWLNAIEDFVSRIEKRNTAACEDLVCSIECLPGSPGPRWDSVPNVDIAAYAAKWKAIHARVRDLYERKILDVDDWQQILLKLGDCPSEEEILVAESGKAATEPGVADGADGSGT